MAVKEIKPKVCTICKGEFIPSSTTARVCSPTCAIEYNRQKDRRKAHRQAKNERLITNYQKKQLMTRAQWFSRLQKLVNQYVTKVRDVGKPCCTCGTTSTSIKYDAGHCFTVAARPDIRFNLKNIHKQCSVKCNQHGSGMRAEYKVFIAENYGDCELEGLELKNPDLKTIFPSWQDIEAEIIRYRKILRNNGIKPNV